MMMAAMGAGAILYQTVSADDGLQTSTVLPLV